MLFAVRKKKFVWKLNGIMYSIIIVRFEIITQSSTKLTLLREIEFNTIYIILILWFRSSWWVSIIDICDFVKTNKTEEKNTDDTMPWQLSEILGPSRP